MFKFSLLSYFVSKQNMIVLLIMFVTSLSLEANDYLNGWEALRQNNLQKARELFIKATQNSKTASDAYFSLMLLDEIENKSEGAIKNLEQALSKMSSPHPYHYALWFYNAMLGEYGKKEKHQLQNLDKIINDSKGIGFLLPPHTM